MNLTKMFEMQRKIDDHIMNEHPELKGQDNLEWKTLALLVEVGECANEWRGFKKWSKDQEPRNKAKCPHCKGKGFQEYFDAFEMFESQYSTEPCNDCEGTGFETSKNPLLEEYVDGLSFVLELGLELGIENFNIRPFKYKNVTTQFNAIFSRASKPGLWVSDIIQLCDEYLGLGEMLGFTQQEIEEAYIAKNAINHKRQDQGY